MFDVEIFKVVAETTLIALLYSLIVVGMFSLIFNTRSTLFVSWWDGDRGGTCVIKLPTDVVVVGDVIKLPTDVVVVGDVGDPKDARRAGRCDPLAPSGGGSSQCSCPVVAILSIPSETDRRLRAAVVTTSACSHR